MNKILQMEKNHEIFKIATQSFFISSCCCIITIFGSELIIAVGVIAVVVPLFEVEKT